jgi:hypothetical protein
MRRLNLLPVLFIASLGVVHSAFAADLSDPILGQWKWFTKSTKVFHADGSITKGGTWRCVNPGEVPRKYVIVWGQGKLVDTLLLTKEENHLSGKNAQGVKVSAERLSREDPDKTADKAPEAPAAWNPSSLTEPLAPYIHNLETLLSLRRIGNKETKAFLAEASGRLITLRQEIVVEREKAADSKTAPFDAALRTCDLISAALAERSNVLGDLKASGAVVNDGRLEEPARKDNLTQGIKGGSFAKAVGSIVERDREREANEKAAQRAAHSDHALTAMAENNWNKRSAEWMQQIAAAYGGIK